MSDFDPTEFDEDCGCIMCSYRKQFKEEQSDKIKKEVRRNLLEKVHEMMLHMQDEEHFQISMGVTDTPYGHFLIVAGFPALIRVLNKLGISSSDQLTMMRMIIGEKDEDDKHK